MTAQKRDDRGLHPFSLFGNESCPGMKILLLIISILSLVIPPTSYRVLVHVSLSVSPTYTPRALTVDAPLSVPPFFHSTVPRSLPPKTRYISSIHGYAAYMLGGYRYIKRMLRTKITLPSTYRQFYVLFREFCHLLHIKIEGSHDNIENVYSICIKDIKL